MELSPKRNKRERKEVVNRKKGVICKTGQAHREREKAKQCERSEEKTVCLKGLITRGLSGLIAGAHGNCKPAEFSMKMPQRRREQARDSDGERGEEEEASGRKAAERRRERRVGRARE